MCGRLNVTNLKKKTTTTEKCEAPNTQTMAVSSQATTKPVNCFLKLEWEHWILFLKTEGFLPLKHIYIFIDRDTVKRCRRERLVDTQYSKGPGLDYHPGHCSQDSAGHDMWHVLQQLSYRGVPTHTL